MSANNNNDYVLAGIKVVEVASMIMAPSCGAVLADFGAEVIKVEPPGKGDTNRYLHQLPGLPKSDIAYSFQQDNRNKKAIAIDLKQAAGMTVLHDLLEQADIFITNFRQPALQKLKLHYDDLKARYPRLIYAYASGYGEQGPEANNAAYDMVSFWARSGLEDALYPIDGWLSPIPSGTGDHVSGMSLFGAISLALYAREKSGRGTKVVTSLTANGVWCNATSVQAALCGAEFPAKRPHADAYNALTLSYKVKGGELIKLTMVEGQKNWPGFCRAIEREDLIRDPRFVEAENRVENMPALIALVSEIFAAMPLALAMQRLQQNDIPHSHIVPIPQIPDDPQLQANDVFVPVVGESFRTVNSPIELGNSKKRAPGPAPAIGAHSWEILQTLGYDDNAIEKLLSDHIIS